ncbi:MAG: hypothetical protein IIC39_00285 [Candidatus Marinimicrobia bacterium]|nr:hypothetical protein [Candidatus Neomarinimicrobiota bacterium]
MRESLQRLIELQKVDAKLIEIEELRGSLPQEVDGLKKDLTDTEETLKESEGKIKDIDKKIREIEGNISQGSVKLEKYKEQLYAVTTNKEYDALTHELETMQGAINESENQILDLMEEKEENEEITSNSKTLLEEIQQDLKSKSKELKKRISETKNVEVDYLKKREKITPDISISLISKYEKIKDAKNGRAVVPVVRGACGGCFHRLPPQLVVEVKKMNKLIHCEACGRVLVSHNEESDN